MHPMKGTRKLEIETPLTITGNSIRMIQGNSCLEDSTAAQLSELSRLVRERKRERDAVDGNCALMLNNQTEQSG